MSARELLEDLHPEVAPVEEAIRGHRYLAAPLPNESLAAFAGEQYTILRSDRRSFATLAARFPELPGGDFFMGLAQGEGEALARSQTAGCSSVSERIQPLMSFSVEVGLSSPKRTREGIA
jgi:hypothetical protein